MQDISNVPILPNIKRRIEEERAKVYKRSRFLRTHVCGNKSSVYDVLYAKKENVSGCVFMKSEGSKTAKGRAIQNLVNIESDDKVKAFICTQDLKDKDITSHNLIMVTKKGQVKKTSLEKYSKPRVNGCCYYYLSYRKLPN
jgi:DNA gyrase/topoisomerase IV subunit A